MDANELMIGDWVQYDVNAWRDDEYDRKCCVPDYQPFKIESGEELDKLILDDGKPKPIPLTPEILEKNGFECTRGGKFAGVFNVADRYECTIKNERGGTEWWIDIQDLGEREETFWMIHIQGHRNVSGYWGYVHELQHALRLAGINKEIVL